MSDRIFGVLDGALVGVVVIGFAIWQLVSINREIGRDKTPPPDSPEGSGHPVGEHRLDDR
ncbi:MAG: hypothetical protein V4659_02975 [Pseudomonadota bacterium]